MIIATAASQLSLPSHAFCIDAVEETYNEGLLKNSFRSMQRAIHRQDVKKLSSCEFIRGDVEGRDVESM
jgi:hypothetical protein